MPKTVILGVGGYGRLLQDILRFDSNVELVGFLDSDKRLHGRIVNDLQVLGDDSVLGQLRQNGVEAAMVAIGDNQVRARIFQSLDALGFSLIGAIHPTAVIGRYVEIGRGVVIMAQAVVNVNARLGDNVVINSAATVDHDNVLMNHCHIWPGAHLAGNVTVGEYSYVGTGASVIPGITIGRNTLVGAGAAVIEDLPDNVVAYGVPARVRKSPPAPMAAATRNRPC